MDLPNNTIRTILIVLATAVIYHIYMMVHVLPHVVEQRAIDLNVATYNAEHDRFVIQDSVYIDDWDLQYLKYGEMVVGNK